MERISSGTTTATASVKPAKGESTAGEISGFDSFWLTNVQRPLMDSDHPKLIN